MGKYFGTDGVRGVANRDLTPELAFRIGRVGGYVLTQKQEKPKVVVGRDTRISGEMLESALIAGLLSAGIEVVRLGVISTPGVAYMTRILGASAGAMISASHNPVEDNGIKFFGRDGYKLPDEMEEEIERCLDEGEDRLPRPVGPDVGSITEYFEGVQKYLHFLKSTVTGNFSNLKIVVDCANGSASGLAPRLLADLEADIVPISANPNGININVRCGSTHPENLRKEVLAQKADLGLAFDGDADRLIAIDEKGRIVDGDHILFICGKSLKEKGKLRQDTVVTTVMSNYGLYEAFRKIGIRTVQTSVGDRYVVEEMRKSGYNLGGEQSGHVIFLDHNTTGDGLLTALQLLQVIQDSGKSLSELAGELVKYPQVLVNVRVKDKNRWNESAPVLEAIEKGNQKLQGRGRILVRPSGTEPIVRVMAEGPDEAEIRRIVQEIAEQVERECT